MGLRVGGALLLLVAAFGLGRITVGAGHPTPATAPELAAYMGEVQHKTHKLDLAIQAENGALALFYLGETREIFEQIERLFPEHDGHAIAEMARAVSEEHLSVVGERIGSERWEEAAAGFSRLLQACNSCHAATQHDFIQVRSTTSNPFNQSFGND
jgi:hypothetical protein